jgi:hypothetical protein
MLVLFDNGRPRGLASFLTGHSVEESRARGWEELANGELTDAAEQVGFEVMVTIDKNVRYQQNLEAREIALVVLENSQWPMVKLVAEDIAAAVNAARPGGYMEVDVPFKQLIPKVEIGLGRNGIPDRVNSLPKEEKPHESSPVFEHHRSSRCRAADSQATRSLRLPGQLCHSSRAAGLRRPWHHSGYFVCEEHFRASGSACRPVSRQTRRRPRVL